MRRLTLTPLIIDPLDMGKSFFSSSNEFKLSLFQPSFVVGFFVESVVARGRLAFVVGASQQRGRGQSEILKHERNQSSTTMDSDIDGGGRSKRIYVSRGP